MCIYVALVLISPLGEAHPHVGGIIALSILIVLLAGASYMVSRRIIHYVLLPAAALWILARVVEALDSGHHAYTHVAPLAGLALSLVVLWGIFGRLESLPRIDSGAVAEAFIGYLILATAFSQVYWILIHLFDHPFSQVILSSQSSTLLYFSMVTLTTVGYGYIVPVNPYVRLVAALEGMIGIFYIAVVVARLAGSYRRPTETGAGDTIR